MFFLIVTLLITAVLHIRLTPSVGSLFTAAHWQLDKFPEISILVGVVFFKMYHTVAVGNVQAKYPEDEHFTSMMILDVDLRQ